MAAKKKTSRTTKTSSVKHNNGYLMVRPLNSSLSAKQESPIIKAMKRFSFIAQQQVTADALPCQEMPIEEILRQYPDSYLAIHVTAVDAQGEPLKGVLVCQATSNRELTQKLCHSEKRPIIIEATFALNP